MDLFIVVLLLTSFAAFVTTHVVLSLRLTLSPPRWRGPVALIVPPLAPWWGFYSRQRWLSGTWLALLAMYLVALIAAQL